MTKTYRAQFKDAKTGENYWRYFQKVKTVVSGLSQEDWYTSRTHDRGYYLLPTDWAVEELYDTIKVTCPVPGYVATTTHLGYLYDHAEEERLKEETLKKLHEAAQTVPSPEQLAEEIAKANSVLALEVSPNHEWLYGPGALVRISDITAVIGVEVEIERKPYQQASIPAEVEQQCIVIMSNKAQITLDLPLALVYNILGRLPPKG